MTKKAMWVRAGGAALLAAGVAVTAAQAQVRAPQPSYPVPGGGQVPSAPQYQVPQLPQPASITPNGEVVEDVVVRVNDQIITRSEVERSEQQLLQDAQANSVPAADVAEKQKDLLRDMIDQQLLLSKAKELGFTCDAELTRRLDDIRKQNHLDSMEALERAAAQQGVSFEDFKKQQCNGILTQQVVREEVGRTVSRSMTRSAEAAYYNGHAKDFEQPESVHLSEILIPTTENPTDAELAQAQAKAADVLAKVRAGMSFTDAAKQYSGGPGAATGGDLGDFKRGALAAALETPTFSQPVGTVTEPIRTRQGFVLLRTDKHTAAGPAPLADVEPQVQEAMYMDALQPALRAYLSKQREEAYVDIKPGFVDTGSTRRETKPVFTTYTPPPVKKKTEAKRRMEQQKDAAAQQRLADARERAAEKAAAKAAKSGGVQNASLAVKPKKVKREKVRFGQAPRNALPTADVPTTVQGADTPLAGQAPGVAMAGTTNPNVVVTKGTGTDADEDPLTPQAGPRKKTRYTARQADIELAKATDKANKAREHVAARPVSATTQEAADEKEQAAPLGLNGDTKKKKAKAKRKKGEAKERLQERPKVVEIAAPVAPTANPALGIDATAPAAKPAAAGSAADRTALPSSTTAPNATNPTAPPVNSSSPNPVPPPQ